MVEASPGAGRRAEASHPKWRLAKARPVAGFQIALERDGSLFVGQLDADVEVPRSIARSVGTAAGVVVGEAGANVGGETGATAVGCPLVLRSM